MNYITKPVIMTDENQRKMIFSLKKAYPLLNVKVIGKSLCERRIFSLSIGKSENPLLIAAGFHGQEWLTTLLALRFAELVLRAKSRREPLWGIDPACICREIIIIPCVNPDGVQIAISGAKTAGRYAQTVDKISASSGEKWSANARGVDINHNFDAGWKELRQIEIESGIVAPSPRRYGGFMPVSEPETAAVVSLCKLRKPRFAVALHSQGEEIFWEYGKNNPFRSRQLAEIFAAVSGYELVRNSGLNSHGGFKDWFIEYFNRPAFTVEIGKGENPLPLSDFGGILERTLPLLAVSAII
ncbi:MAG: M14 family metallocarboxypeptidase [Clostridia bacterium]|nr:M14 family metallocarboxypeptidase [Clostridia bacterium]